MEGSLLPLTFNDNIMLGWKGHHHCRPGAGAEMHYHTYLTALRCEMAHVWPVNAWMYHNLVPVKVLWSMSCWFVFR